MNAKKLIAAAAVVMLALPSANAEQKLGLSQKGKDLMLEIPDSLMGRRFIVNTKLNESTDPMAAIGAALSKKLIYRFTREDSTLVITAPGKAFVVEDNEDNIARALSMSKREQVKFVIPIKKWSDDSTSFTVKGDKLFGGSDVVNLKGLASSFGTVNSSSIVGSARILECKDYPNHVSLRREASWKVNDAGNVTVTYTTSLAILEEKELSHRDADSRVGTRSVSYASYSSDGEVKSEKWASRFDLSGDRKLVFYMDTVLTPSWQAAAKEGILEWNKAFVEAGLGKKIEVRTLTADIDVNDPLVSTVTFRGSQAQKVSGQILEDEKGEILSAKIMIPGGFRAYVRQTSAYTMSDVDYRYARYDIPDDAVCEVLKACVMKTTGLCLGLTANKAGSYAYTPAQLSNPKFTRQNGITASILDDVLFNYFADKGDIQKGLVTIVDRIGSYDKYAIAWLYADAPIDTKQVYVGDQTFAIDPRSMAVHPNYINGTLDLGNDVIAAHKALTRHLKNVAAESFTWVTSEEGEADSFAVLFPDWLWLTKYNAIYMMAKMAGAMYVNDVRDGDSRPRLEPLPRKYQRACVKEAFAALDDFDFISKEYLQFAGTNRNTYSTLNSSFRDILAIRPRMAAVAMAEQEAGSKYTLDEYMKDIQDGTFAHAAKGDLSNMGVLRIQQYIATLNSFSPVLQANMNRGLNPYGFAAEYDAAEFRIDGVPVSYLDGVEAMCVKYLKRARGILGKGQKKAKNSYAKGEYDFLLLMIDSSLGDIK